MKKILYHLLLESDWEEVQKAKLLSPESLKTEGFIHLSTPENVIETANLYFKDKDKIIILEFEEVSLIGPYLKYEQSRGGKLFPHYFKEISLDLVQSSRTLLNKGEGFFCPNKRPYGP